MDKQLLIAIGFGLTVAGCYMWWNGWTPTDYAVLFGESIVFGMGVMLLWRERASLLEH